MNSNETKIAILETKIDQVSIDIKEIKNSLTHHVDWEEKYRKEDHEKWEALFDKLNNKIGGLDKRYASKWTEKIVYAVIIVMVTGIAGAVINSIL